MHEPQHRHICGFAKLKTIQLHIFKVRREDTFEHEPFGARNLGRQTQDHAHLFVGIRCLWVPTNQQRRGQIGLEGGQQPECAQRHLEFEAVARRAEVRAAAGFDLPLANLGRGEAVRGGHNRLDQAREGALKTVFARFAQHLVDLHAGQIGRDAVDQVRRVVGLNAGGHIETVTGDRKPLGRHVVRDLTIGEEIARNAIFERKQTTDPEGRIRDHVAIAGAVTARHGDQRGLGHGLRHKGRKPVARVVIGKAALVLGGEEQRTGSVLKERVNAVDHDGSVFGVVQRWPRLQGDAAAEQLLDTERNLGIEHREFAVGILYVQQQNTEIGELCGWRIRDGIGRLQFRCVVVDD
mmetsp:Transcript_22457/g.36298  ORF Transcript_22457/g.36298 Transcript_22457/m.36298 type:complete len:351 (-) Transcript_22457:879-1931(-)